MINIKAAKGLGLNLPQTRYRDEVNPPFAEPSSGVEGRVVARSRVKRAVGGRTNVGSNRRSACSPKECNISTIVERSPLIDSHW